MIIDLPSAIIMYILFTIGAVIATWVSMPGLPGQRFLRIWNVNLIAWVVVYTGILLQTMNPLIGLFVVNSAALLVFWFNGRMIHRLTGWNHRLYTYVFILTIVQSLSMILEVIMYGSSILRSVTGSLPFLFMYCYSFLALIRHRRENRGRMSVTRRNSYVFFTATIGLQIVLWSAREVIGIVTLESSNASQLYRFSLYNLATILGVPTLVLLQSAAILLLAHALENQQKRAAEDRFLVYNTDAAYSQLLNGMNHEVNTPLGNLIILGDLLISEGTDDSDSLRQLIELSTGSINKLEVILRERNELMNSSLRHFDDIELSTALERLNSLLSRGFSARHIRFELAYPGPSVRLSYQYLFTILSGIAELLQLEVYRDDEDHIITLEYLSERHLSHLMIGYQGRGNLNTFLAEEAEHTDGFDPYQSPREELLHLKGWWIRHLVDSYYSGHLEVSQEEAEGWGRIDFSFQEPRQNLGGGN